MEPCSVKDVLEIIREICNMCPRLVEWGSVISRVSQLLRALELRPTLRQIFYRLVSEGLIPRATTSA